MPFSPFEMYKLFGLNYHNIMGFFSSFFLNLWEYVVITKNTSKLPYLLQAFKQITIAVAWLLDWWISVKSAAMEVSFIGYELVE